MMSEKDVIQEAMRGAKEVLKEIERADHKVEVNNLGGRQSLLEESYYLLDPKALREIARVLYLGNKRYGPCNWRAISEYDHINHALAHVVNAMELLGIPHVDEAPAGDRSIVEHLSHAACRLFMALAVYLQGGPSDRFSSKRA